MERLEALTLSRLARPVVFLEAEPPPGDLPSWHGHIPFAFWLTDVLRPRLFVELGTHGGTSYCAFCQAIKHLEVPTACYAVDTWKGDSQAGFYGEEVFTALAAYHESRYAGFSSLIRSTFAEALPQFADGSVDLLHVDGYHSYESVKADIESWFPKLSRRGVVLLHDINVRDRDFGAWRLWEELSRQYPSFGFLHSHGLGVLAIGSEMPDDIEWLVHSDETDGLTSEIRAFFSRLGAVVSESRERTSLVAEVDRLSGTLRTLHDEVASIAARAATGPLRETELETAIAAKDASIGELEMRLGDQERTIDELRARAGDLETAIERRDARIANLEKSDIESQSAASERRADAGEHQAALALTETRDTALERRRQDLEDKLTQRLEHVKRLEAALQAKDERIGQLEELTERMLSSRGWRLLERYRHLRDRLQSAATSPLRLLARTRRRVLNGGGAPPPTTHQSDAYSIIANSGLFDPVYYGSRYPDVLRHVDPLVDYIETGADNGRDPHPLFDTSFYLERNPDVAQAGLNPLAHFVAWGAAEGRDPHPSFDTSYYLENNPDVAQAGCNPLLHYAQWGAIEGRRGYADVSSGDTSAPASGPANTAGRAGGSSAISLGTRTTPTLDPRLDPYASEPNLRRIQFVRDLPRWAGRHATRSRGLSVIVLNLNKPELIIPFIRKMRPLCDAAAAAGWELEVLVGDTGSTDPKVLSFYDKLPSYARVIRGLEYQFSKSNNEVFFKEARHDTALFVNNDIIDDSAGAAFSLMRQHLNKQDGTGVVGACLWFPNGTTQHLGIDFFRAGPLRGMCYHPNAHEDIGAGELSEWWTTPAVTGACLMIDSSLFEKLSGFDEQYRSECQDVDLCLRAARLGYRTDIVNVGRLVHIENATRPKGHEDWDDRRLFVRRWAAFVEASF
jgi:GT2 family glycosyltransferase/uncharacterized coiled-coil protein SlyX